MHSRSRATLFGLLVGGCLLFVRRGFTALPFRMVRELEADQADGRGHQHVLRRGCFATFLSPFQANPSQGGTVLGNGTWLNVGGNQAVTYGGATASSQTGGPPYDDPDGGKSYVLSHPSGTGG